MAAHAFTPVVRQKSFIQPTPDNTNRNNHIGLLTKRHNREVAKWTYVYRMLSKKQQKKFEDWKTNEADESMAQILENMPAILAKQASKTGSTDMNEQLDHLTAEYDEKVAEWTFVHGMLTKQQQKKFEDWKTEQMNLEIDEFISDNSSDEYEHKEGTDDDEPDMACS